MCTRVCMFQLPNTTRGNVLNVSKCRRAAKKNGRGVMITLQRWQVMTQEKMEGKSQTEQASEEWNGFNKLKYVKANIFLKNILHISAFARRKSPHESPGRCSSSVCLCADVDKNVFYSLGLSFWFVIWKVFFVCFNLLVWLLGSFSDCAVPLLSSAGRPPHQREASFMRSAAARLSLICALTYIMFDSLVLTGPCVKNVWLSQEDQPPPTLVLFACLSETSALVALFPETPQGQSPATEKD